ncbi:hypothetical protein, partial [Candidatus Binatus sp.]
MAARGRSFAGYPRALTGMVVALIATTTALFLFFQANPQTFPSPIDSLSYQMDAGRDVPEVVEQSES